MIQDYKMIRDSFKNFQAFPQKLTMIIYFLVKLGI